jgi:uncharacterized protein YbjT (DUF2867 family)
MDIVIAGAHGKVARRLARLLVARGDSVRGLIRNPDHAEDLRDDGSEPVLLDLEDAEPDQVAEAVAGADAVVFAAGAGPGSGPERKRTVDYEGAVKLVKAAEELGVRRYVIVSSMGAGDPASASEAMRPYQQAKHDADEALAGSSLDWTIVRPGGLTDEPAAGRVTLAERLGRSGQVTRADVALVLLECLGADNTIRKTFEVLEGDVPVREAVAAL